MIAQVWEYKVFGKQFIKKNTWENLQEYDRNEDQNQYPKYAIFLWFFQPLKTNKDKSLLTQKLF